MSTPESSEAARERHLRQKAKVHGLRLLKSGQGRYALGDLHTDHIVAGDDGVKPVYTLEDVESYLAGGMNEFMQASLRKELARWREAPDDLPVFEHESKGDMIGEIQLALERPCSLTEDRWNLFFGKLLHERLGGELPGTCKGDLANSKAVMREMGLTDQEVVAALRVAHILGGHCDCEMVLNVVDRILPPGGGRRGRRGLRAGSRRRR